MRGFDHKGLCPDLCVVSRPLVVSAPWPGLCSLRSPLGLAGTWGNSRRLVMAAALHPCGHGDDQALWLLERGSTCAS